MPTLEASFDARDRRFAVIVARFNDAITERLLSSALDCLRRHGAAESAQDVIRVPGAFEIPFAARLAAESGQYDAVICLGALIRGATSHYEVLASEVTGALGRIAESSGVPVAFGVLTCDTLEQAVERSGGKGSNKGFDAALTAIEMANLARELKSRSNRQA